MTHIFAAGNEFWSHKRRENNVDRDLQAESTESNEDDSILLSPKWGNTNKSPSTQTLLKYACASSSRDAVLFASSYLAMVQAMIEGGWVRRYMAR